MHVVSRVGFVIIHIRATLVRVSDLLIVRDGVKAGERVIVDGIQKARPGSPVNPSAAGSSPPAAKAEAKVPEKPAEVKPAKKAGGK